jgi:peptidyl-dipeptidase Dcp
MPQELIMRIRNAETFNKGWETVEFLASGLVDMDLHLMETVPADFDIGAFERQDLERLGMPRDIIMRHRPTHFAHIFANDYSAGYYGYLWAEVLEEDAWQSFVETGDVFNQERARAFCDYIFCAGNLRPTAEAFALFRGRGPEVAPLLRSRGFPVPAGAAAAGETGH